MSITSRHANSARYRTFAYGFAGAMFTVMAFGSTQTFAQSWVPWGDTPFSYRDRDSSDNDGPRRDRRTRPAKRSVIERDEREPTPRVPVAKTTGTLSKQQPSPALLAVVSLSSQRLTLYNSTGELLQSPISSGQSGHRTPTGIFSIIQKNRFHASNIYSGAPMPFMQRLTWSGIAMHAGRLPGYPASHGCIRLPYDTAADLFATTRMGMRVIVSPTDIQAKPFAHARLPEPTLTPAMPSTAAMAEVGPGPIPLVQQASAAAAVKVDSGATVETRYDTPLQRAAAQRAKATAAIADAVKAAKLAQEVAKRASAAADLANADVRAAATTHRKLEDEVDSLRTAAQSASTPDDAARAGALLAGAEARADDALKRIVDLEDIDVERAKELFAATNAATDAQDAVDAARTAAKATDKIMEPISVFISRKEGKLFVRQGLAPVFDAPVTVKDTSPLGTHLYVALNADAATGKLDWTAVSVPDGAGAGDEDERHTKRGRKIAPEPVGRPSTAAEALERIEMADETRAWIAERIWLGGSVIISDLGISNETGKGTDFVVLTK